MIIINNNKKINKKNRNIEEVKKTENNWKTTPLADRYRAFLKKIQTKVSVSAIKFLFN